jgi:hypothetical protein
MLWERNETFNKTELHRYHLPHQLLNQALLERLFLVDIEALPLAERKYHIASVFIVTAFAGYVFSSSLDT